MRSIDGDFGKLARDEIDLHMDGRAGDVAKEAIRHLRGLLIPGVRQLLSDGLVGFGFELSCVEGEIDIKRTDVSFVGERKFGNPTAHDRQLVEVFGKDGQHFDQDGSARIHFVHSLPPDFDSPTASSGRSSLSKTSPAASFPRPDSAIKSR